MELKIKQLWMSIYDVGLFIILIMIIGVLNKLLLKELSHDDQSLLQNFIEWYAIFYTLVLSLIVGQSWKRYNGINSEIDREADALVLLKQTGRMVKNGGDLTLALSLAIKRYVYCIRILTVKDTRASASSHERLKDIRDVVILMIQSDIDDCLKTELLHQYYEVYDARGDRFDLIEQTMPNYTWVVFIAASLIWVWGFLWLEIFSPYFKYYIFVSVMATVSFLFFMARDLNNPTDGSWKIDFSPFFVNIF